MTSSPKKRVTFSGHADADNHTTSPLKKVTFSKTALVIPPKINGSVLYLDDVERLFYTDSEIKDMLKECKQGGDLSSFWCPLRMQRVNLLYNLVKQEQFMQRLKQQSPSLEKKAFDWQPVAKASLKLTAYSQKLAQQRGLRQAEEAKEDGCEEANLMGRENPAKVETKAIVENKSAKAPKLNSSYVHSVAPLVAPLTPSRFGKRIIRF